LSTAAVGRRLRRTDRPTRWATRVAPWRTANSHLEARPTYPDRARSRRLAGVAVRTAASAATRSARKPATLRLLRQPGHGGGAGSALEAARGPWLQQHHRRHRQRVVGLLPPE